MGARRRPDARAASRRAVANDARLETDKRRQLAVYYAEQAVGCLRRLARDRNADGSLIQELDADASLGDLRESGPFQAWRSENVRGGPPGRESGHQ